MQLQISLLITPFLGAAFWEGPKDTGCHLLPFLIGSTTFVASVLPLLSPFTGT